MLPVRWVVDGAGLIGVDTARAGNHIEGLVLVSAPTDAGVVSAQARLPVHWIVRNAALVVGCTGRARAEGDSILIPGARVCAIIVTIKTGPPVLRRVIEAQVIVI